MSVYFLNLYESNLTVEDDDGAEFPSMEAALQAAITSARSILCAEVSLGRMPLDWFIEVVNGDRSERGSVFFRDVVKITGQH